MALPAPDETLSGKELSLLRLDAEPYRFLTERAAAHEVSEVEIHRYVQELGAENPEQAVILVREAIRKGDMVTAFEFAKEVRTLAEFDLDGAYQALLDIARRENVLESDHWTDVRLEVAFRAHYLEAGAGKMDALFERLTEDEDVDPDIKTRVTAAYFQGP
jgi:hypothetical protein